MGNVISGSTGSGNNGNGITITDSGTALNVVMGNIVGLNAAGTAAISNVRQGILIFNGAANTRVGTDGDGFNDAAERNIVSANFSHGIRIVGTGTDHTIVAGNYVGTDITGTVDLGNGASGVLVTHDWSAVLRPCASPITCSSTSATQGGGPRT